VGQEIPDQNSDETMPSASTNPTPPQDSDPLILRDDKHSIVPEAVKAERDVRSSGEVPHVNSKPSAKESKGHFCYCT
jgi:hypothetical protein